MARVLIVDDGSTVTEALMRLLEQSGEVYIAEPEPINIQALHHDLINCVEVVKPERPNFTKFQNNFKRRGR